MNEIVIRQATRADLDRCAQLLTDLFSIETDFVIDHEKQKAGLRLLFDNPKRSAILVAEKRNAVVGMVTGQLVVSTAVGGYSILLEDLFVVKDCRRLNIGGRLVEGLIAWGVEKGARRVQLVADSDNHFALKFYQSNNFVRGKMVGLYRFLN
ncbi:MAG TPA: GNAT family N-acetyltransferase [Spirochaetota bacterium]